MAKEFILPFSELKATLDDTPIEPTLEITENGIYNVKGYVYADVNVEGGGSSDFSIARGTLHTSIENESVSISEAVVIDDYDPTQPYMTPVVEGDWHDNNTIDFVLYNGAYILGFSSSNYNIDNVSVTGGAEVLDHSGLIKITGDFMLNVSFSV